MSTTGIYSLIKVAIISHLAVQTTVQAAWKLSWSDDFNGKANGAPDSKKWIFDIGDKNQGWGNSELQYYTSDRRNSALDGSGNLVIYARKADVSLPCYYGPCKYTSARLLTKGKFEQQFGKFEARIKAPTGKGIWPAFWTLGNEGTWPNSGEIDIMEIRGSSPGTVSGTIHGPGYSGGQGPTASYTLPNGASLANDFHIYSVEWSDKQIIWKVDGKQYHVQTKDQGPLKGKTWAFNRPFFIILNVAVGGNFDGVPNDKTVLPQKMIIDYVRVYKQA